MRIPAVWAAVVLIPTLSAQTPLDWAVSLRGRYQTFTEPVISVFATAQLAALVCPVDHGKGLGLYEEALHGLSLLSPQAFVDARHVLPSDSFTALWKSVTGSAAKCDPSLEQYFDGERARAKMQTERQNAGLTLRLARGRIPSDPDRAGQLAQAAIGVSDAQHLDIAFLTRFLSELRERAADVSDDVFPAALNLIVSAPAPSPGLLMELGKFLFVSRRLATNPDKDQDSDVVTAAGVSIGRFEDLRDSTIPDEVRDYIEAAIKMFEAPDTSNLDPVTAFALAYQLVPLATDLAPDALDRLKEMLVQLQSLAGSGAAQVQSQLSASSANPNSEDDAVKRGHVIAAVIHAIAAGHFSEARDIGKDNSDMISRSQIASLIDFNDSCAASSHKDLAWASTLADALVPGIKRSLLYAGIAHAAAGRDAALGPFQLAMKDIAPLPAEQRMFTLAANAGAVIQIAPDNALMALGLWVDAANDAYTSPHRGVFDPKIQRHFNKKGAMSGDSPLILYNRRGLYEVVDTGQHRYNFMLRVPGVESLTLPSVMSLARGVDPGRLEAVILGLRDESQIALGLNALAAIRLKE